MIILTGMHDKQMMARDTDKLLRLLAVEHWTAATKHEYVRASEIQVDQVVAGLGRIRAVQRVESQP
jgi:hypothetical protein